MSNFFSSKSSAGERTGDKMRSRISNIGIELISWIAAGGILFLSVKYLILFFK